METEISFSGIFFCILLVIGFVVLGEELTWVKTQACGRNQASRRAGDLVQ